MSYGATEIYRKEISVFGDHADWRCHIGIYFDENGSGRSGDGHFEPESFGGWVDGGRLLGKIRIGSANLCAVYQVYAEFAET